MRETPLEQKRTFANVTDATSFLLKDLGFRSRRLRDFICGLQGVAGARHEFDCTHRVLARRLNHGGKAETAETFVSRCLAALEKEQHRTGRILFHVERGGGVERKPTHYIDYVTPAAVWIVRQAQASEVWAESHTRAMQVFVPAATEMLPLVKESQAEEIDGDVLAVPDGVRIARNRKHAITRACANFEIIAENHGDIIEHAQSLAKEILERAFIIAQREGVQFCTPSDDQNISKLDGALIYAGRGWRVFPCEARGKRPFIKKWQKCATTEATQIIEWWSKWPDSNIAIATGEASGLLAIDIDPRHGGDETLRGLIEAHGELPDTKVAATGGGGFHSLFIYPIDSNIRNSVGRLGAGIDVRGEGGYIIVPPSVHKSGNLYKWLKDFTLAPLPQWLFKRLTEEKPTSKVSRETKSSAVSESLISEGQRNETLFRRVAAPCAGKGASYEEIEAAVLKYGKIQANPARDVELPPRGKSKKARVFNEEEVFQFIEATRQESNDLVFVFALFTGLRPCEFIGLEYDRVELVKEGDDERGLAHITRTVVKLKGGGWEFSSPKTEAGIRSIYFPAFLYHELEARKESHLTRLKILGQSHRLIFTNSKGNPLDRDNLGARQFKNVLTRAKLSCEGRTLYTLRRSSATFSLLLGDSLKGISEKLGHTKVEFTQNEYMDVLPTMQRITSDRLENFLLRRNLADSEAEGVM